MHGNGNDFVIMNSIDSDISLTEDFIKNIASRENGIGFDQLILVSPPEDHRHDFLVQFFNADGGEAMMCLNGIRCASRYIWMSNFAPTRKMILETRSRVTLVEPLGEVNVIATIDIPNFYKDPELELTLKKLIDMPFSLIDAGNLHLCIEADNFDNFELEEFYRQIESTIKPHQINVSIYKKRDTDIRIATYENGVGMTLSCGSASASVAFLNIKEGLALDICSDGGSLNFLVANDKLIMQGPTELSFNGVINE